MKVVGRDADTVVTVSKDQLRTDTSEVRITSNGGFTEVPMQPGEHLHLSADNPIMVAQFVKGLVSGESSDNPSGSGKLYRCKCLCFCVYGVH